VAVVFGGPSEERAISIESGGAVAAALEGEGFRARRILIDETVDPFLDEIKARDETVFLALHGRYGEDGSVQAALETAGVRYTGSGPAASWAAMHKAETKRLCQAEAILVPKYYMAGGRPCRDPVAQMRERGLAPPLVVKPEASGSSLGVSVVRDEAALETALEGALAFGPEALVEEYHEGRELSVAVLAGEALPVLELVAAREFYDYKAKYTDEATRVVCPAELSPDEAARVREAALRTFVALGARDIGRVDVILGADGVPWVLELNTIPGFTSHSLVPRAASADGIGFGDLCARIVALALERA